MRPKGGALKVLIITERTFEGKQLKETLQQLPFTQYDRNFRLELYEMESVKNALDKMEADAQKGAFYDLAITAHQMKKLSGLQFAQLAAKNKAFSGLNVILVTDAEVPQLKEEAEKAGIRAVLKSPATAEELQNALGSIADASAKKTRQRLDAELEMLKMAGEQPGNEAYRDLYSKTAEALAKSLAMAPWRHQLNNQLAQLYAGAENYAAAVPLCKNLIKIDFSDKEAHRLLALCYKRLGKSIEDTESLRELIESRPGEAAIHCRLAYAFLEEKAPEKAEEHFRKALELHAPGDAPSVKARAWFGLAKLMFDKDGSAPQPDALAPLLAALKNALQTDPSLNTGYFMLHAILKSAGKEAEAALALEAAKKIVPASSEAWLEWFFFHLAASDTANAEQSLQKALAMDTENQTTRVRAGEAYFRAQMYEKAIDLFGKALEINPSDIRLYNWLGISYRRLKQAGKATEQYRKALVIDPDDFNIHYNLGRACAQIKDHVNARKAFEEALRLHPELDEAKEALAQLPPAAV